MNHQGSRATPFEDQAPPGRFVPGLSQRPSDTTVTGGLWLTSVISISLLIKNKRYLNRCHPLFPQFWPLKNKKLLFILFGRLGGDAHGYPNLEKIYSNVKFSQLMVTMVTHSISFPCNNFKPKLNKIFL
jgi:hypothetical protein